VALLDYTGAEHMGTARVGRTSTLAEV
jgi:hypothetical protein